MIKKVLFLVAAILMGSMTAVMAKINYIPLYKMDSQSNDSVPSAQLFITQDGHKLILPSNTEFYLYEVFNISAFDGLISGSINNDRETLVVLPAKLVGDYEIRLFAPAYTYHGFFTLEREGEASTSEDTGPWENITLLGSNTSQQAILDNMMTLHVVEYNKKLEDEIPEEYLCFLNEEERDAYEKRKEQAGQRRIGLLTEELLDILPQVVYEQQDGTYSISYLDIIPVLVCCIQELKTQLDSRTEKIVDAMMSRNSSADVSAVRAAIGNTLLSTAPTSVSEPALVRFILTENVTNAHITVTDMGGRVVTRVPVSPSETSVSINSDALGEGIFLCTLFANGEIVGTKRLVKTK